MTIIGPMTIRHRAGGAAEIWTANDKLQTKASFWLFICVSNGYTGSMPEKDVGLRIRVERNLRDDFLKVCRAQDRPAAQVLREFMRGYVAIHTLADRPVTSSGQIGKTTGRLKGG